VASAGALNVSQTEGSNVAPPSDLDPPPQPWSELPGGLGLQLRSSLV
jgi:hypothetical protein